VRGTVQHSYLWRAVIAHTRYQRVTTVLFLLVVAIAPCIAWLSAHLRDRVRSVSQQVAADGAAFRPLTSLAHPGCWAGYVSCAGIAITDNRRGGCIQPFAILDPGNLLAGLTVEGKFWSRRYGQCDSPGQREIPIPRDIIQWSSAYRIDTDDRRGGCQQTFSIEKRTDVALDIDFTFNGDPRGNAAILGLGQPFTDNRSSPASTRTLVPAAT
jgi:hypothetical protein